MLRRPVSDRGPQVSALGWDTLTLFSVHPESGVIRADRCRVLAPCLPPAREGTAEFLRVPLWRCQRYEPGGIRACLYGNLRQGGMGAILAPRRQEWGDHCPLIVTGARG